MGFYWHNFLVIKLHLIDMLEANASEMDANEYENFSNSSDEAHNFFMFS